MKKYETRIMSMYDARAFMQNMRWFANRGTIRIKKMERGRASVRASRLAWSWWVS
jgi:hypothetical protein